MLLKSWREFLHNISAKRRRSHGRRRCLPPPPISAQILETRLLLSGTTPSADAYDGGDNYSIGWGDSVTLNASAADFPAGAVLAFAWDLNSDGTYGGAGEPTTSSETLVWDVLSDQVGLSAWTESGWIQLEVSDQFGNTVWDTASIDLPSVMDAAADAGGDAGTGTYVAAWGSSLALAGTASGFPVGAVLAYAWDFNNDTVYDDAVTDTPTISWSDLENKVGLNAESETGTVWFQVSDLFGHTASDSATITLPTVMDAAADAGGDPGTDTYAAAWGESVALAGTASGFPPGATLTYAWDFNNDMVYDDATTATPTIFWDDLENKVGLNAESETGSVEFQVSDQFGHTASDTAFIDLPSVTGIADAGGDFGTDTYTVGYNSSLTLTASASDFPPGSILTYAWDLNNDGSFDDDMDDLLDTTGATQVLLWNQLTAMTPPPVGGGWWFDVGLQVTDQYGHTANDSASIALPTEVTVWAVRIDDGVEGGDQAHFQIHRSWDDGPLGVCLSIPRERSDLAWLVAAI
jgi:hypothetical protein